MNHGKLRSLIYGKFNTASELARHMHWGKQKLHRIASGKQEPNLWDISSLSDALGTPIMEIVDIFLHNESPNRQHIVTKKEGGPKWKSN